MSKIEVIGEDISVTIRSRVTQDRRKLSRIAVRLDCRFEFKEKSYDALITDISLEGAFCSTSFLPPLGSRILVGIQLEHLHKPILIEGNILRVSGSGSDYRKQGSFSVQFVRTPLELIKFISEMSAKASSASAGQN